MPFFYAYLKLFQVFPQLIKVWKKVNKFHPKVFVIFLLPLKNNCKLSVLGFAVLHDFPAAVKGKYNISKAVDWVWPNATLGKGEKGKGKWCVAKYGDPILGICPLHLTHPSAHSQQWTHTRSSGQPCCDVAAMLLLILIIELDHWLQLKYNISVNNKPQLL